MSWAARRGPGRAGVPQRPLVPQVFQCLLIEGENSGEGAVREAERFLISDAEFEAFLDRHREVSCLVPESNQKVGARALDIRDRASRWAGRGRSGARRGAWEEHRAACDLRVTCCRGHGDEPGLSARAVYTEQGEDLGAKWTEPPGIVISKEQPPPPPTHTHRATLDPGQGAEALARENLLDSDGTQTRFWDAGHVGAAHLVRETPRGAQASEER